MEGRIRRLFAASALSLIMLATTAGVQPSAVASAAGTPTPHWSDPAQGPHARDEARHLQDHPKFSPARTAIQPRAARVDHVAGPAIASAPSGRPLQREVFGFAPWWALSHNGSWNYSLMSTVAYFGLDLYADGSIVQGANNGWNGWNSQDMVNTINQAHQAGDRVVVVIKAFDNTTICSITSTTPPSTAAQTAITNTIQQIQAKRIDGVNVDFEGSNTKCPNGQMLQSELTSFMGKLSSQVHQQVPGSFVTIDTYSGSASWEGGEFSISALAPVVDAMFDMAYDMASGNLPGQAGPNAPLNGWTYNDTTSVNQFLTKAPASKVILGVPYYGYKSSTSSTQPYATITGNTTAEPYSYLGGDFACAASQGLKQDWDTTASSPWASWISPASSTDPNCPAAYNSPRELYYDNAQSLGYKYNLVNQTNIRGTGMWALGYDGNAPELWQAIQDKFVVWSGWESLGGSLGSAPSVASWGSGRLDIFARGNDGSLIHKWYDGSSWHAWESLGGNLTSSPAAVSWASGRLDVFARGPANDLIHKWYDGNAWSGWESLGGVLADAPGVSSWGAGRLDIFVRGGDNALWHRWYNGGWFGWESLGGVLTSNPAAASMTMGRLDVFARGGDRALWHRWYDANGWGNWESLGGILASGPAVSTWGTGRLDVFMRGTDNALWHDVYASNTWSWEYLGGSLTSGPGAVSWGLGRIDAFGRGPDGTLWHKWYQAG